MTPGIVSAACWRVGSRRLPKGSQLSQYKRPLEPLESQHMAFQAPSGLAGWYTEKSGLATKWSLSKQCASGIYPMAASRHQFSQGLGRPIFRLGTRVSRDGPVDLGW